MLNRTRLIGPLQYYFYGFAAIDGPRNLAGLQPEGGVASSDAA